MSGQAVAVTLSASELEFLQFVLAVRRAELSDRMRKDARAGLDTSEDAAARAAALALWSRLDRARLGRPESVT